MKKLINILKESSYDFREPIDRKVKSEIYELPISNAMKKRGYSEEDYTIEVTIDYVSNKKQIGAIHRTAVTSSGSPLSTETFDSYKVYYTFDNNEALYNKSDMVKFQRAVKNIKKIGKKI